MKLWNYLRALNAGEWVALAILVGALTIVLRYGFGTAWSAVTFSIQPDEVDVGRNYDLVAQRSMAAAAWWMVFITGISAIVGAAGLFLIYRTLQEAKRSSDAAVKSVRYSEKAAESSAESAELARTALQSTREMGEIQMRAYAVLSSAKIRLEDITIRPMIAITVTNSGQTPARRLTLNFTIDLFNNETDEVAYSMSFTENLPDLAGQKEFPFEMDTTIKFAVADIAPFSRNDRTIRMRGKLTYDTVFPKIQDEQPFSLQTVCDRHTSPYELQRMRTWVPRKENGVLK